MKYFLDTEFLEGTQKSFFGKTKPTIDLISIGIVSEDGREYYAISKDFNLKEVWNRWDGEYYEQTAYEKYHQFPMKKKYWIRENILKPIWSEIVNDHLSVFDDWSFNYKNLKKALIKYGKSNKQISMEIIDFCHHETFKKYNDSFLYLDEILDNISNWDVEDKPEFYTYYGDYDWVVFCWLFGRMIDLPKGFPMYSKDLKQILDEKQEMRNKLKKIIDETKVLKKYEGNQLVNPLNLKDHPDYPKQKNNHNALADALWNKSLYEFLQKI